MATGILARYKGFIKDSTSLVGATAVAKISGLFMVPIVARLFDPDDFGVVALVLTISIILGPLVSLRYERAIVLPENNNIALGLVKLSAWLVVATGGILAISVYMVSLAFDEVAMFKEMGVWIYAIPVLVILTGFGNILAEWCARNAFFKTIGFSEITVSLVSNGARILLGLAGGSSVFGLIAGNLLSLIGKIVVLWRVARRTIMMLPEGLSSIGILAVAKQYKEFPLYSMPTGFLNTAFQKLPVIMLGLMFMPGVVGLYAMASRLGKLPIDIIGLPLRKIYVQRIARMRNKGVPLRGMLVKTTVGLFFVGITPFMCLLFYGEEIFSFVLGEKWAESGVFASILMPWLFSIFVISPSSANFVVLKRQKLWLKIQICAGVIGMSAFALGIYVRAQPAEVLLWFSILSACLNIAVLVIAYLITSKLDKQAPVAEI